MNQDENPNIVFFPEKQYLLLWGFNLEKTSGDEKNLDLIIKSIFLTFAKIAKSKNKILHDRSFTIWIGEYNGFLWIGVPGDITTSISDIISKQFELFYKYDEMEYGNTPQIPMTPFFSYTNGSLIEYGRDAFIGKETTDEKYGTGLKIIFKSFCFK
jgi:hypothetical protein